MVFVMKPELGASQIIVAHSIYTGLRREMSPDVWGRLLPLTIYACPLQCYRRERDETSLLTTVALLQSFKVQGSKLGGFALCSDFALWICLLKRAEGSNCQRCPLNFLQEETLFKILFLKSKYSYFPPQRNHCVKPNVVGYLQTVMELIRNLKYSLSVHE